MREYLDTGYWLEPGAVTVYCIAAAVESGVDMVALTQLLWRSDALSWNLPVAAGSISITSMRT